MPTNVLLRSKNRKYISEFSERRGCLSTSFHTVAGGRNLQNQPREQGFWLPCSNSNPGLSLQCPPTPVPLLSGQLLGTSGSLALFVHKMSPEVIKDHRVLQLFLTGRLLKCEFRILDSEFFALWPRTNHLTFQEFNFLVVIKEWIISKIPYLLPKL